MSKNIFTRNGICWARFKVNGVRYCFSLRTRSEAVAERRLKTERQRIVDTAYYGAADPVSWEAAVLEWTRAIPRLGIKPRTQKRYATSLWQLREWLVGVDVQKMDSKLVKRVIADRSRRGVTNATIRRDLTAMASVLSICVDEGWIEENPARMIDRGRIKEKRNPITLPHRDDIDRVLALGSRFIDMAALADETGMRQTEISTLQHRQIDRERGIAMLTETKSGRVRAVPLSAKAIAIIDRQPRHFRSGNVFWRGDGDAFKNVDAQFYATTKRVQQKVLQSGGQFSRFRFHDLRHLFAVNFLKDRRGTIYDLQQVLGHASIKTTEGYLAYLSPDEKRDAIQGVQQNAPQDQRFAEVEGSKNG